MFKGLFSLFESSKFYFVLITFGVATASNLTGHLDGPSFVNLIEWMGVSFLGAHTLSDLGSQITSVLNAAKPPPPDPK